jgi:hypothetical protein
MGFRVADTIERCKRPSVMRQNFAKERIALRSPKIAWNDECMKLCPTQKGYLAKEVKTKATKLDNKC